MDAFHVSYLFVSLCLCESLLSAFAYSSTTGNTRPHCIYKVM